MNDIQEFYKKEFTLEIEFNDNVYILDSTKHDLSDINALLTGDKITEPFGYCFNEEIYLSLIECLMIEIFNINTNFSSIKEAYVHDELLWKVKDKGFSLSLIK